MFCQNACALVLLVTRDDTLIGAPQVFQRCLGFTLSCFPSLDARHAEGLDFLGEVRASQLEFVFAHWIAVPAPGFPRGDLGINAAIYVIGKRG